MVVAIVAALADLAPQDLVLMVLQDTAVVHQDTVPVHVVLAAVAQVAEAVLFVENVSM
jgi:hypothetical protein